MKKRVLYCSHRGWTTANADKPGVRILAQSPRVIDFTLYWDFQVRFRHLEMANNAPHVRSFKDIPEGLADAFLRVYRGLSRDLQDQGIDPATLDLGALPWLHVLTVEGTEAVTIIRDQDSELDGERYMILSNTY